MQLTNENTEVVTFEWKLMETYNPTGCLLNAGIVWDQPVPMRAHQPRLTKQGPVCWELHVHWVVEIPFVNIKI